MLERDKFGLELRIKPDSEIIVDFLINWSGPLCDDGSASLSTYILGDSNDLMETLKIKIFQA